MKTKQILFTAPQTAELLELDVRPTEKDDVLVKMHYTVVSGGTERANLMCIPNTQQHYPIYLGYCGVGTVIEVGEDVTDLEPGNRVLVYHGNHAVYNIRKRSDIIKVEDDNIPDIDAAFVIIAAMGLEGVRKLQLEIGESAMVVGLGLLGIFSVEFCRLNGANPVIAVDLNAERRELALKLGADYALDPTAPDFFKMVEKLTHGKGINGCVEVTGASSALQTALKSASYMGRISLLGCTRVSDCPVDFYKQVHRPGVKLIGAHNSVRPLHESYPYHWTNQDDCKAILNLLSAGRIQVEPIVSRIASPNDAQKIYTELCNDKNFPLGTVFNWIDL